MQKALGAAVAVLFAAAGCVSTFQQHGAFKAAEIVPAETVAKIGDVVPFELRPPVAAGTRWTLSTWGPVRFADARDLSLIEWVAEHTPIHLEAVVAPWDLRGKEESKEWLWFGMADTAHDQPFEHPLPIRRAPFRELSPVGTDAGFAVGGAEPRLSFAKRRDRMVVSYLTRAEDGTPHLPKIRAALVETGEKKVLYAEIWTNYGETAKTKVGYEVTLSYPASVGAPVEVAVVEWTGHGWNYGPFDVHRLTVNDAASSAEQHDHSEPATSR
jgi:hypothetical protein